MQQCPFDLAAGEVARVDDPVGRMPALPAKIKLCIRIRELCADGDQVAQTVRSLTDHGLHGIAM